VKQPISIPHPLPEPLVEIIATRFKVLGEPMRIKLLDALRAGPATVQELQIATGGSQQNVSKHLRVLQTAGILSRSKEGNFVLYEISDDVVFQLCELVCGGVQDQIAELGALLQPQGAIR
jgi:DNA-binding transcriptional ArsR family regulator